MNITELVHCTVCGKYILHESVDPINSPDKSNLYKVSSWIREQNNLFQNTPEIDLEKFNSLLQIKDKRIQEKFDLMISHLNEYKNMIISHEMYAQCWIKDSEEFRILFDQAVDHGFVPKESLLGTSVMFSGFTFEGLQYLESLEDPNVNFKNIFVAFNFEDDLKKVFDTYVKEGIEELDFNYVVVNQSNTEHDRAISDEIIAKLKSSRIVIADFTNHRNSVYFEAGFAMGMKIPIIWTCQEGHTEELSFDTRQYPHLVWSDGEDLKEQIMNRIRVIL